MKVSTSLFFDRSTNQMIKGQSELAKTQPGSRVVRK